MPVSAGLTWKRLTEPRQSRVGSNKRTWQRFSVKAACWRVDGHRFLPVLVSLRNSMWYTLHSGRKRPRSSSPATAPQWRSQQVHPHSLCRAEGALWSHIKHVVPVKLLRFFVETVYWWFINKITAWSKWWILVKIFQQFSDETEFFPSIFTINMAVGQRLILISLLCDWYRTICPDLMTSEVSDCRWIYRCDCWLRLSQFSLTRNPDILTI